MSIKRIDTASLENMSATELDGFRILLESELQATREKEDDLLALLSSISGDATGISTHSI